MKTVLTLPETPSQTAFAPIPGPKTDILRRPPRDLRQNPLAFLAELPQKHGDIAQIEAFGIHAVLLSHPDLVRDVLLTHNRNFIKGEGLQRAKRLLGEGLLTSERETHLKNRRLLQPVFLKNRIENYADSMRDRAAQTSRRWQNGQTVDMAREMSRLTLAVVGDTLFSADVEGDAGEVGRALDTTLELFNALSSPWAPLWELLPFGPNRRFQKARETLDGVIFRLINTRRASGQDTGDFLSLLLNSRYDDGSAMTDEQIRDEAMTIFLAGHETTANWLAWTWLLLAQNPEAVAGLEAEIDVVLAERAPQRDDLGKLAFTRRVLSESLRLFPPAWIVGRRAVADYEISHEGKKYRVPKGSIVAMSQWAMHRDMRFWPEPLKFDTNRFLPQNVEKRPKFVFFPFSAGTRSCIGEGFAWMEAALVLSTLAQNWRVTLTGEPPRPVPGITLRPGGGLLMRLERR